MTLSMTSLSTARPQAAAACMADDGGEKDGRGVRGEREERGREEHAGGEKKTELGEEEEDDDDDNDEI